MQKNKKIENPPIEMGNMFKIVLIILIVFGIFYVITYYIKKGNNETYNNQPNTYTTIQYDEILIGSILNQPEDEYYVLLVSQDLYNRYYKNYLSQYSNGNKFYYAIIENGLNKSYFNETSNLKPEDIKDFKFNTISLLKIKESKIAETYEGNENVMKEIIEINK